MLEPIMHCWYTKITVTVYWNNLDYMLSQHFRYTVEVIWVYHEYTIIQIYNILTFQCYEHFNILTRTIMQSGIIPVAIDIFFFGV